MLSQTVDIGRGEDARDLDRMKEIGYMMHRIIVLKKNHLQELVCDCEPSQGRIENDCPRVRPRDREGEDG